LPVARLQPRIRRLRKPERLAIKKRSLLRIPHPKLDVMNALQPERIAARRGNVAESGSGVGGGGHGSVFITGNAHAASEVHSGGMKTQNNREQAIDATPVSQQRLEKRIDELARQGKVRKVNGTEAGRDLTTRPAKVPREMLRAMRKESKGGWRHPRI